MKFSGQREYDHDKAQLRTGVLICNLGTPDAPTPKALRRYLREFLSDPRVVEIPALLWWLILHLIILPLRPAKSAKLYQKIWTAEGSPLLKNSRMQRQALQDKVDQHWKCQVPVALGMRYGNPSIASALEYLRAQNVRDIIVLPLYPQYCAATSGATFDAVSAQCRQYRWVPSLHFISQYHQSQGYLQAVADSIRAHIEKYGLPERLLFSYHGTPQRYLEQGDPYHCLCLQTTRLIRDRLALDEALTMTTFQSRFGGAPWLQPYTDKTLLAFPEQGIKHVAVICPGFSADCLETLEEIAITGKNSFLQAGGKEYHYIPALNAEPAHIDALYQVIEPLLAISPYIE